VLVFHGNAGSALDRKYYPDALEKLGYRVILVEYPGYGGRRGKLGEGSFVADARDLVTLARDEFGDPIYVWGESLGCGVAIAVAADRQWRLRGYPAYPGTLWEIRASPLLAAGRALADQRPRQYPKP
jgi:pimeloyl-ACP methyl ester carboxylesterase